MIYSCNDDDSFTTSSSAKLTFEMDTVRFDTVITTVGSSTKRFKVFNKNDDGIRIISVGLESGGESGFRINVDGHSGNILNDLQILKKDHQQKEAPPTYRIRTKNTQGKKPYSDKKQDD